MNSILTLTRSMSKKLRKTNGSGRQRGTPLSAACNKNQNCHISKNKAMEARPHAACTRHQRPAHLGPIFGKSQQLVRKTKGNLVHAETLLDKMGEKGYLCTTFKNRHFGKQRYGAHQNGSEYGYAHGLLTLSRLVRRQSCFSFLATPFNQNSTEALTSFGSAVGTRQKCEVLFRIVEKS